MSKTFKNGALALAVSLIISGSAFAADRGTITVNGEVTDSTCEAGFGGGSAADGTITLPVVSTSQLATAGTTSGDTNFAIDLSKCSAAVKGVRAYFEAGSTVDPLTGYLNNTAANNNVAVQLLDGNGAPIKAGTTEQAQPYVAIAAGTGTLAYQARYVSVGTPSAGVVTSQVSYTLDYQ